MCWNISHVLFLISLMLIGSMSEIHLDFDTRSFHRLANAERALILEITAVHQQKYGENLDEESDLSYFLEFLQADTGFPYEESVEEYLMQPTNRFKLIERYIYDWPNLQDALYQLGSEISVEDHFKSECEELPNMGYLRQTVVYLNNVITLYNVKYSAVRAGSAFSARQSIRKPLSAALNSGNLVVLTQLSWEVGQITHCVKWGDLTDKDLITSSEPFIIPGEPEWLNFYLVFLECLVRVGAAEQNEVAQEIQTHYSNNPKVQHQVNQIIQLLPLPGLHNKLVLRCKEHYTAITPAGKCTIQHYRYQTLRVEHYSNHSVYKDLHVLCDNDVTSPKCSLMLRHVFISDFGYKPLNNLLLYNHGTEDRYLVIANVTGAQALHAGDSALMTEDSLTNTIICPLKRGLESLQIYSIT